VGRWVGVGQAAGEICENSAMKKLKICLDIEENDIFQQYHPLNLCQDNSLDIREL
jgi:hypothetical protein